MCICHYAAAMFKINKGRLCMEIIPRGTIDIEHLINSLVH